MIEDLGSFEIVGNRPSSVVPTEVAGAIVTGYVAILQMGWLRRDTAVRRHANGKIARVGAPQAMHRKARKRGAK